MWLSNRKEKKKWGEELEQLLDTFLPLFSRMDDKDYEKMNAELVFASIFSKKPSEDEQGTIEEFFEEVNGRSISELDPAILMLLSLYRQRFKSTGIDQGADNPNGQETYKQVIPSDGRSFQDKFSLDGQERYSLDISVKNSFNQVELMTYQSMLEKKYASRVEEFLRSDIYDRVKDGLIDREEMYILTHWVFYLSYLNEFPEFFSYFPEKGQKLLEQRLSSYTVSCLIKEDYDLLAELLLCYLLMGQSVKMTYDSIFKKAFRQLYHFMKKLEETTKSHELSEISGYYHTVLVLKMVKDLIEVSE
ncbi:hypothetical protein D3H64_00275 [Atopobacter sp. AH10]|uniref:DUF6895 family protein n=1 Tax=Atopobacter sp. AH10 TaxID=2315861 RepID=UPI000EF1E470|nr:hypothetical protein [Atopobacter sp. AH10]RLK64249.1 hypothetical protein D3H64_00275 [Atopobacter sp. AH10]